MRKLLLFFAMLCVSIGTWAEVSIYTRQQMQLTSENGVGIYGWDTPGDVAALLGGTYSGTINSNSTATIEDARETTFLKVGDGDEQLNQADINAIFALPNLKYLRLDECTISGDVDFSQITVASSSLLDVTLPAGVSAEQVKAAGDKIKVASSGVKLVAAVTGKTTVTQVPHHYYELNGTTYEYTGSVSEGQKSVSVTDMPVMANLTPVEGYPKYSYQNTKTDRNPVIIEESDLEGRTSQDYDNGVLTNFYTPEEIEVKLTDNGEVTTSYVVVDGVRYEQSLTSDQYEKVGDKYYLKSGVYIHNQTYGDIFPQQSEVVFVTAQQFTYSFLDNHQEKTIVYNGPEPTKVGESYYAMVSNRYPAYGYRFKYSSIYKYSYTDKNNLAAYYDSENPDEDGKIQIDTYSGTLDLNTTYETVSNTVVDGATAYVNVAGSLADAQNLFDSETKTAFNGAKNVTIIGNVDANDLDAVKNFTAVEVLDLSEADAGSVSVKDNLNIVNNNGTDVIAPDNLGTAAALAEYAAANVKGVFSHNGTKLSMLAINNTNIATRVANYLESTENTLSVNTADWRQSGNGLDMNAFNDVDIETLEFNQATVNNTTLANTHIKNLLMSNVYPSYNDQTKTYNISGSTNLEVADFSTVPIGSINAQNLNSLTDLYVNHSTFQRMNKQENKGVINVTRTSNNYDNLTIHADAEGGADTGDTGNAFRWERVIPSLDKDTHYSNSAFASFIYEKAFMRFHEPENGDKYAYFYGNNTSYDDEGSVKISMDEDRRGNLSEILADLPANKRFSRVSIVGPITQDDIAAFSSINADILDLSGATLQDKNNSYAEDISILSSTSTLNNNVRFVVLPTATTQADLGLIFDTDKQKVVSTLLQGFTGLYSAAAYNATNKTLTSFNDKAGTLQPMMAVLGLSMTDATKFKPKNLPEGQSTYIPLDNTVDNLYLSGDVNAYDVVSKQTLDGDGHLRWNMEHTEGLVENPERVIDGGTDGLEVYGALNNSNHIKIVDLKYASFLENEDMTITAWGNTGTTTKKIVLSQMPTVKKIPADCMNQTGWFITGVCIPSNIEVIESRAFATISYVWTTPNVRDPEGLNTQVDNGMVDKDGNQIFATDIITHKDNPDYNYCYDFKNGGTPGVTGGTYTFSSAIKVIETSAFKNTNAVVTDVYVLNTEAPECHVDAFNNVMYINSDGYDKNYENGIIERKNYKYMSMLHYPRQTTTPNVQRYTDPTRDYSIATGMRDGKGATLYFPTQTEYLRSFAQGTYGYTWNAWNPNRQFGMMLGNAAVDLGGAWTAGDQAKANAAYTSNEEVDDATKKWYTFYDTTLGGNTKPESLVDYYNVYWNERSYSSSGTEAQHLYPEGKDYRGWHQFVLMGYASNSLLDEEPYRSYITDNDWWTICPTFDITLAESAILFGYAQNIHGSSPSQYPFVSKLRYVTRNYSNKSVTLNFSPDLTKQKENRTGNNNHAEVDDNGVMTTNGTEFSSNDVVMKAGVPYLIKPSFDPNAPRQFRIFRSQEDLQKFRDQFTSDEWAAKQFKEFLAFANEGLYDKIHASVDIDGDTQREMVEAGIYTVPVFVSQADGVGLVKENVEIDESTNKPKVFRIKNIDYYKSADWKYSFVGSWYKSFMPQYSYFLGWNSTKKCAQFYYKTELSDFEKNNMTWANESGIIIPVPASKYENGVLSYKITPASEHDAAQWKITDLVDDSYVAQGSSQGAKVLSMQFDAPDVYDDETTGISISDNTKRPIETQGVNVYTLDGQYVGNSLRSLAKGIYIVNGKKYVVK